jgi:hypothetical protein
MLGSTQWQWLKSQLRGSTARFKVVTSGITLREDGATESWLTGYPEEFRRLLALLDQFPGVVLVSGDVHYCAVRKHDNSSLPSVVTSTLPPLITPTLKRSLYEVITSGVGRFDEVRNDSCDSAKDQGYALLDFDLAQHSEKMTVRLFRQDGTERTADATTIL